ncbi:hypothetical protein [Endozoicomonas arenosclerae]|uniref:hypothetical protein n=1 Tax=Endozoicomonas arenosclerae TaxID=1633495 RepID=UPI0007805002|nr:hypothetical protein [Endozoicomonas arenosclerae]
MNRSRWFWITFFLLSTSFSAPSFGLWLLFERFEGLASAYQSMGYQAVHFQEVQHDGATPFQTLMKGNSYFIPHPSPQSAQTREHILGDRNCVTEPVKQSRAGSGSVGSGASQKSADSSSPDPMKSSPGELSVGSPEAWFNRQSRATFNNRNSNSSGGGSRRRGQQCRTLTSAEIQPGKPQQMFFKVESMPGAKEGTTSTHTQFTRILPSVSNSSHENLGFSSMDLLQVLYVHDASANTDSDDLLQLMLESDENDPEFDQYSEEQVRALEEFRRRARRALVQLHGEYIDALWGISCGWAIDALYIVETGSLSLEMISPEQQQILLVPIDLQQVPEVLLAGLQGLNVSAE